MRRDIKNLDSKDGRLLMRRNGFLGSLFLAAIAMTGCGQTEPAGQTAAAQDTSGPDKVVTDFLHSVSKGDKEAANKLLTPLARQKTAEMQMELPGGSPTAQFKVGDVELVSDGGAHVACDWSDIDGEGQRHTDKVIWVLRQEAEGWRIAGMATKVFEDELPVILNFEDPADMVRKQELVEQEMERRASGEAQQANKGPTDETKAR
jgi:hypothetical protein